MINQLGRQPPRPLPNRRSLSPSPVKRSRSKNYNSVAQDPIIDDNDVDCDDEETLQLQLEEIQARLKLKKLQNKMKQASNMSRDIFTAVSGLDKKLEIADKQIVREQASQRTRQSNVDVPVSPVRKKRQLEPRCSPGRVLLGIDKGLKGGDVSLKRMPSRGKETNELNKPNIGSFLQKRDLQSNARYLGTEDRVRDLDKPKSFNERLSAARRQDNDLRTRELHKKKCKSTAFNIDLTQMQNFKGNAVEFPESPPILPEFSRDEILNSVSTTNNIIKKQSTTNISSVTRTSNNSKEQSKNDFGKEQSKSSSDPSITAISKSFRDGKESDIPQFEPYSSQHLTKRIIPHQNLTRSLKGKKIYLIPDLFREIKGPEFSTPDIEEDLVVLAIIASKSEPKTHQSNFTKNNRGKFLVFTLTDLKWELDLFLFDSAFEKFWKMTPGTIIAILNPVIMPPPRSKADTGKFSLMLNSDEDTVLEIGTARDLGFCKSVKRDGKPCNSWVDKRHSEFCDYHVSSSLKKTHAGRMEVNTMTFGKGGYGGYKGFGKKKYNSVSRNGYAEPRSDSRTSYNLESHSKIFIGQKSTVNLLDDVDFDPDAFHRGSTKEERMTRRILSQEKERNLEKKLAIIGTGLGAEYARVRQAGTSLKSTNCSNTLEECYDAKFPGLLEGKVKDITLSPVKRKRSDLVPKGWGKNLADDLGKMRKSTKLNASPALKKTRFVTEKGIKEAGRESFSVDANVFNNSDDDLEII